MATRSWRESWQGRGRSRRNYYYWKGPIQTTVAFKTHYHDAGGDEGVVYPV